MGRPARSPASTRPPPSGAPRSADFSPQHPARSPSPPPTSNPPKGSADTPVRPKPQRPRRLFSRTLPPVLRLRAPRSTFHPHPLARRPKPALDCGSPLPLSPSQPAGAPKRQSRHSPRSADFSPQHPARSPTPPFPTRIHWPAGDRLLSDCWGFPQLSPRTPTPSSSHSPPRSDGF